MFEAEAEQIYNTLTMGYPHSSHRTFEEAWQSFGGDGPLIEFVYLLKNNQTLTKRLQNQIDFLLQEGISDEERASFGYALFWMAKRNLAITLLFSSNEIVKSVCTGEIQSCADAIRGLNKLVKPERYVYFIDDFDITSENTLESKYLNVVLQIKNIFSSAVQLSSDRWYVEILGI